MSRLLAILLLCGGCTGTRKALSYPAFATAGPHGELAEVEVDAGYRKSTPTRYAPETLEHQGRVLALPTWTSRRGILSVRPLADGTRIRIYQRGMGARDRGFQPVSAVTGALRGRLENEVRLLPNTLDGPTTLHLSDLANPLTGRSLSDDDLLLLEVSADDAPNETYLFRVRQPGLRFGGGTGLLVRVPLPGNEDVETLTPAIVASLTIGWRTRGHQRTGRWFSDRINLIGSVGIGSTQIVDPELDVTALQTWFNAALAGGGIELYGIFSVQVMGNMTSVFREASESPAALAVGFDVVEFGRLATEMGYRFIRSDRLSKPRKDP